MGKFVISSIKETQSYFDRNGKPQKIEFTLILKRSPGTTNSIAWSVSDSCEIELDDFDNALQFPNTEAKVTISLGYQEKGLTKIGTYYVREIAIDGARRTIKIVANIGRFRFRIV